VYTGAILIGAISFAAFLLTVPGGHRHVVLIDDLVQGAVPAFLAAIWSFEAFVRRRRSKGARQIRRASIFFCLSAVSFAVGQAIWTCYENVVHQPPFPSWADIPFLAAYPFLAMGTFLLASPPKSLAARVRLSLDALICLTSLVIISWYFILGPALLQSSMSPLAKIVGTAYPFLDVVIFSSLLLLTMNAKSQQLRPAISAVLAGALCIIVTDTLYDYQTLRGSYHTGSVFDVLWPTGYAMVVVAALILNRMPASLHRDQIPDSTLSRSLSDSNSNRWRVLIPSVLVLGAWALVAIVVATPGNQDLQPVMAVAAGLLACLVVCRQVLTSRDNDRLMDDLRSAWRETVARAEEVEGMNAALEESREKFKSAFDHAANGNGAGRP